MSEQRPPDWENTVLALRVVLVQLDGWAVQRLLESALAMAAEHPYVRAVAGHTAVHYGSRGHAKCGADYPDMALTTVPLNVTCRTCRGWESVISYVR